MVARSILIASLGLTGAKPLKATYKAEFPEHVSELMPVYLTPELNHEWNHRMSRQILKTDTKYGDIVHQTYGLPWPLKPRELLMHCENSISHREATLTATCHSVLTDTVPVTDAAVRMEIMESQWRFEALPGNGKMKTRVTVYILISERFAVGVRTRRATATTPRTRSLFLPLAHIPSPSSTHAASFVIKFVQDHSLKESVTQFVKACRRLKLPPLAEYAGWKRTRQQRLSALAAAKLTPVDEAEDGSSFSNNSSSALIRFALSLLAMALGYVLLVNEGYSGRVWWKTRHAPRAVRKLGRAVHRARDQRELLHVPLSDATNISTPLQRSCSHPSMAEFYSNGGNGGGGGGGNRSAKEDVAALLLTPSSGPGSYARGASRRSLSASDLERSQLC